MRKLAAIGLSALALLLAPATADACGAGPRVGLAYLHRTLPNPLPTGSFIAEVEFDNDLQVSLRGLRGHVRRTIQGDYYGPAVIIRPRISTSCDSPFANGTSGFLIGRPTGMEGGDLVIDPMRASVSPPPFEALRFPRREATVARPSL